MSNLKEWQKAWAKLDKLNRRCEKCKSRFKCFTTNTSNRPHQLDGINFQIAECCIRCKNSAFKTGKPPAPPTPPEPWVTKIGFNYYLRVGKCKIHNVLIHQFSSCNKFERKLHDGLTYEVSDQLALELNYVNNNYKFPRYCVIDKKNIGEEEQKIWEQWKMES